MLFGLKHKAIAGAIAGVAALVWMHRAARAKGKPATEPDTDVGLGFGLDAGGDKVCSYSPPGSDNEADPIFINCDELGDLLLGKDTGR